MRKHRSLLLTLLALGLLVSPASANPALLGQAPTPVGDPFQVNAYTSGNQSQGRVAMADDGSFVVVWQTDTPSDGVVGRRFNSTGIAAGDEFAVTTHTGIDSDLEVAMADDGDFVVLWHSAETESVRFQRFASDGSPNGAGVDVVTSLAFTEIDLALQGNTGFVVTWRGPGLSGSPGSSDPRALLGSESVMARRYGSDGAALGPAFEVATDPSRARDPRIAASDNGFLVVWTASTAVGNDTDNTSVQARLFDASGAPMDGVFQVNTITIGSQANAAAAADADGNFVVFWESFESGVFNARVGEVSGQAPPAVSKGGATMQIRGRQILADGTPGGSLDIGSSSGDQEHPRVETEPAGFIVQWKEPNIQAQRFDNQGQTVGSRVQVNTLSVPNDSSPELALNASGQMVSTWHSETSAGDDTDSNSIQGRRLMIPCDGGTQECPSIFADGFETGDTTAWSN